MLRVKETHDVTYYIVSNNQGTILIYTTSSAIAYFVETHTHNLDPNLRLNVGGDPGTRRTNLHHPIFHHIRRYTR